MTFFYCVISTAPLRLMSSANSLRIHSIPLSKPVIKMLKGTGSSLEVTTHIWPPLGHRSIDHNSLPVTIQPILYPPNTPSFKYMSLKFRDKDVVGTISKNFQKSR